MMSGTSTACTARPIEPVFICPHIIAEVNCVKLCVTAIAPRNTALPQSCASMTAGNAHRPFAAVFFVVLS